MTRSAVWLPLFDELADPRAIADLAAAAEEAGWDGFFVWDHVHWHAPVEAIADPWIALTAAAMTTSRLALGPMVTPLARRRPAKLARETASLDRVSGGRLVLGVGLGDDRFGGEYTRFGDETEPRVRAAMLDESLAILHRAWTGEPVRHRGEHFVVDDVAFRPAPAAGRIPVWVAAMPGSSRPLRRAARHDGFFPVNLASADELAAAGSAVQALREHRDAPYDLVAAVPPHADPAPYVTAGATWVLTDTEPGLRLDTARGIVRDGPTLR